MSDRRRYPVSCLECRRRKIKCNRLSPCDQCQKRLLSCRFPYTFRKVPLPVEDDHSATIEGHYEIPKDEQPPALTKRSYFYNQTGQFFGHGSSVAMLTSVLDDEVDKVIANHNILISDEAEAVKVYVPSIFDDKYQNYKALKFLLQLFLDTSYLFDGVSTKDLWSTLEQVVGQPGSTYLSVDPENCQRVVLLNIVFATAARQLTPSNFILVESEMSATDLAENFFSCYQRQSKTFGADTLTSMRAMLLSNQHYYYLRLYETCWTESFRAVGAAYAIGLHTPSRGEVDTDEVLGRDLVWGHLEYENALMSCTYARPGAISKTPYARDLSRSPYLQQLCRTVKILRRLTDLKLMADTSYQRVLSLDADIDLELQTPGTASDSQLSRDVILTAARAIVHQPYLKQRQFSCQSTLDALILMLQSAEELIKLKGNIPLVASNPTAECYLYQGLIVLYCFLNYFHEDYGQYLPKIEHIQTLMTTIFHKMHDIWSANIVSLLKGIRQYMDYTNDALMDYSSANGLMADNFVPLYFLDVEAPFAPHDDATYQHPFY